MSLSIGDDWTYVMGVNARVDVHDAIPPVTMKSNEAIIVDDEGCDGWVAERGHCSLMRNAEPQRAALLACSEEADQNRTRGGGEDSAPFTDSYVVHSM